MDALLAAGHLVDRGFLGAGSKDDAAWFAPHFCHLRVQPGQLEFDGEWGRWTARYHGWGYADVVIERREFAMVREHASVWHSAHPDGQLAMIGQQAVAVFG